MIAGLLVDGISGGQSRDSSIRSHYGYGRARVVVEDRRSHGGILSVGSEHDTGHERLIHFALVMNIGFLAIIRFVVHVVNAAVTILAQLRWRKQGRGWGIWWMDEALRSRNPTAAGERTKQYTRFDKLYTLGPQGKPCTSKPLSYHDSHVACLVSGLCIQCTGDAGSVAISDRRELSFIALAIIRISLREKRCSTVGACRSYVLMGFAPLRVLTVGSIRACGCINEAGRSIAYQPHELEIYRATGVGSDDVRCLRVSVGV